MSGMRAHGIDRVARIWPAPGLAFAAGMVAGGAVGPAEMDVGAVVWGVVTGAVWGRLWPLPRSRRWRWVLTGKLERRELAQGWRGSADGGTFLVLRTPSPFSAAAAGCIAVLG
jgi:hypothetical protein